MTDEEMLEMKIARVRILRTLGLVSLETSQRLLGYAQQIARSGFTQAEMEGLKEGPRLSAGNGSYCYECRLSPPHGYRNAVGDVFLCRTCYGFKMKKG